MCMAGTEQKSKKEGFQSKREKEVDKMNRGDS